MHIQYHPQWFTNARAEEQVCPSMGKRAAQWEPHRCPQGFQLAPPTSTSDLWNLPEGTAMSWGTGTNLRWFSTAQTECKGHTLSCSWPNGPALMKWSLGDTQTVSPGRGYGRSWLRTSSWLVVPHRMSGRRDRGNIHCASADSANLSQKQRWFELTWLDLQWGGLRTPIRPLLPALVGI